MRDVTQNAIVSPKRRRDTLKKRRQEKKKTLLRITPLLSGLNVVKLFVLEDLDLLKNIIKNILEIEIVLRS